MFGLLLAAGSVVAFGAIALASAVRSTGSKLIQGDTALVPLTQVQLVQVGNAGDAADLLRFSQGFAKVNVNVINVIPAGDFAIGTIIGLSPPVKFPLAAVISITRDGQVLT
jgi:hypothetical protein